MGLGYGVGVLHARIPSTNVVLGAGSLQLVVGCLQSQPRQGTIRRAVRHVDQKILDMGCPLLGKPPRNTAWHWFCTKPSKTEIPVVVEQSRPFGKFDKFRHCLAHPLRK